MRLSSVHTLHIDRIKAVKVSCNSEGHRLMEGHKAVHPCCESYQGNVPPFNCTSPHAGNLYAAYHKSVHWSLVNLNFTSCSNHNLVPMLHLPSYPPSYSRQPSALQLYGFPHHCFTAFLQDPSWPDCACRSCEGSCGTLGSHSSLHRIATRRLQVARCSRDSNTLASGQGMPSRCAPPFPIPNRLLTATLLVYLLLYFQLMPAECAYYASVG